MEAETAVK